MDIPSSSRLFPSSSISLSDIIQDKVPDLATLYLVTAKNVVVVLYSSMVCVNLSLGA